MNNLLAILNKPRESDEFIDYTVHLAQDINANVHLLYVQNPSSYLVGNAGMMGTTIVENQQLEQRLKNEAKVYVTNYINKLKENASEKLHIDFSVLSGVVTDIAREFVSKNKADLIVLQNDNEDGFWVQSPTNLELIEGVNCPIWVLPKNVKYKSIKEIIYTTDYKEEDVENLKKLTDLFKSFNSNITALHITDSIDFEERIKKSGFQEMIQRKTDYNYLTVKVMPEIENKEVVDLIKDFSSEINANLIVVLKENKSLFKKIFTSSETKKIIENVEVPVMVLHE